MAKHEINALEIVFNHLYCGGVVETNDSQWLEMDTSEKTSIYFKLNEIDTRKIDVQSATTVQELAKLCISQWLGMDTDGNMSLFFKINEVETRKINIPSMTVQELAEISKTLPDDLLLEYSCTKPTKELLDKNLLKELEVVSLEMGENLKQSRN